MVLPNLRDIVLVFTFLTVVSSLTIRQLIEQRDELKTLKSYMERGPVGLWTTFGQTGATQERYTFFAPNNEAFEMTPSEIRQKYSIGSSAATTELNNILKYHTVYHDDGETLTGAALEDGHASSLAVNTPKLFFKHLDNDNFVNGAKIVIYDLQASNGIVHIIDRFLYKVGLPQSIFGYIDSQKTALRDRTSKFMRLLGEYERNGYTRASVALNSKKVTAFVPTDEYIDRMEKQYFSKLENDATELKKVMESHIIENDIYYAQPINVSADLLLNNQMNPILAMQGQVYFKRFGADLYVSNDCAQGKIIASDTTASNGVLHYVTRLIGYVYNDAYNQIKEDEDLSSFEGHVFKGSDDFVNRLKAGAGASVPDSQKMTIFAPINSAFKTISGQDLTQNVTKLDIILKTHMLQGVVEVSELRDGMLRDTLQPKKKALFTRDSQGNVYVDVDYIKGQIVKGDVCVKNGIIHYVDRVLGIPAESLHDFVKYHSETGSLWAAVVDAGLQQLLMDRFKKTTLFAPIDKAFQLMREGRVGRTILNEDQRLRQVLYRHAVNGEVYLNEIQESRKLANYKNPADTWTLIKEGEEYFVEYQDTRKRVVPGFYDMKMTNGVIHFLEEVIYDESPLELQSTSSATYLKVFTVMPLVLTILSIFHNLKL